VLKRYSSWLWTAVVFQFLTAAIHSLSFFRRPIPQNETERQLFDLMMTYRRDLGGGFQPTMENLFTALSACFPILCLLGGLTIAYCLKKKVTTDILKGIVRIQVVIFGMTFAVMLIFTFLPPIVLTGLVFLLLLAGSFMIPRHAA
jgi:hypothetical protein